MAGLFAFNHKWLPTVVAEPRQNVSIADNQLSSLLLSNGVTVTSVSGFAVIGAAQLSVTWGNPRVIGEV